MTHVLHVIGARPNFMKATPVMDAVQSYSAIRQTLVHTGQHYDDAMSGAFFRELGLRTPDVNLGVGSGSHAEQTARVMMLFEDCLNRYGPDLVLVYGDVNSTLAAALVCAKLGVPVGHVEAGLRAYDRRMPEEINRVLTDQIATLHFTPSSDADENLLREGVARDGIHLVGNVMIDTLISMLPRAADRPILDDLGLTRAADDGQGQPEGDRRTRPFVLVTLHRPSNVDDRTALLDVLAALHAVAQQLPVVFPIHPRTRVRVEAEGLLDLQSGSTDGLMLIPPLGYLDFLCLQRKATVVITDSGGIQEETTYLGVPCLTLRENTERPVTVTLGTNTLLGHELHRLPDEVAKCAVGSGKRGCVPPLWDGQAGRRIAAVVAGMFAGSIPVLPGIS